MRRSTVGRRFGWRTFRIATWKAMSRSPFASSTAIALLGLLSAHCGGTAPAPVAPQPTPAPTGLGASASPSPTPANGGEGAHRLVIAAAGCWFGGTWSDALGEQDAIKQAGIEARCHELERRVWAGTEDKTHYEQLRALETNAVADVLATVDEAAKRDGADGARRSALVKLAAALADEERELMLARRASDRVKRDLDREPEKLTADEVDAVIPLRAHAKLDALLGLNVGDLSREAHALALFRALDRVEIARGLPRHLKLYAVADTFHLLFGVTVPDAPRDAATKLVPGMWLAFLADTATAAGYPVGDKATTPLEKDAVAWAGMLRGFGDKLKADEDGVSSNTELAHVLMVTLHRLDAEYAAQRAAADTLHTSQAKSR
jgi:hypothetical protein